MLLRVVEERGGQPSAILESKTLQSSPKSGATTGEMVEVAAAAQGSRLAVVKLPEAKRVFAVLPRR